MGRPSFHSRSGSAGVALLLAAALATFAGGQTPEFERAADRIRAGDREAAEEQLAAWLAARPGDAAALHRVGAFWLVFGAPERAPGPLREALALDPGFVDARLALGQALGQLGAAEEALRELDRAATLAPERHEAPYLAAAVLDRAGRVGEALDRARRAVALAPRDPGLRRFRGRLALRLEQWPEAQAEFEAALGLGYREDPAIFADLGAALTGQERLVAARAAWERYHALAPDDTEALLQLGYLEWRTGDPEASEARLEAAIARDPGLRRAHHLLGLAALRRLDLDGAEAAFRRALEAGEDFPEAWFHLGKIALRRGNAAEAVRHLGTAISHDPDYAEAYYQLGFARRRLGDAAGAARALARFEELGRTRDEGPREELR